MNYELKIGKITRCLPIVPISENVAIVSFVVLGDTELVVEAASIMKDKIKDIDYILTAEAKGIAFSQELTRVLSLKEFIVARKSVKSYMMDPLEVKVHSITTEKEQNLYLDSVDIEKIRGKNICIVDDVISTGESINALETLVEAAGAHTIQKVAILAEGDAIKRKDIEVLGRIPLYRVLGEGEYEVMEP